MIHCKKLHY